jgi:acylglycerol lipase
LDASSTRGRLASADGTELATRHWAPDATPWAALLIVHGLGEHGGRYEHVGARFAAAGIDARSVDLRGFGASGGRRAYVERWARFHDDVEVALGVVRDAALGRPVVLYGHSLGGLVSLGYVLAGRPAPDLLVLTGPALEADVPASKRLAARLLSRVLPYYEIRNELDMTVLSADATVGERYLADELNYHRTTARLAGEALAEQDRVRAALQNLGVPTLVLHGAEDRLVPARASEPLDGLPRVTRRLYPELRHEIHNEVGWEAIVDDVVAWIRNQVGARPAPAPSAAPAAAGARLG